MAPSEACNEAAKALVKAKNVLQVRIDMLDPSDIDSSYLHTIPEELDGIRDLLTEFMVMIRAFLENFNIEVEASVVTAWQEESTKAKKAVITQKKLIWAKYNELLAPVKPLTYYEQQSLQNQTKQLTLQETTVSSVSSTVGVEERKVLGVAEVKYDAFVASSKKILSFTRDRDKDTLAGEEDDNIRKYMRELSDLRQSVKQFFEM